ncbi:MAG: YfhO family protein [Nitrospinota bacterium]
MGVLSRTLSKAPWLLLLISAFVFFSDVFLFNKWFIDAPSLFNVYPWKVAHFFPITEATGSDPDLLLWPAQKFMAEELFRNGRLPVWNPLILTGLPFLAGALKAAFAVTNLAHLLPHFLWAIHIKMFAQMVLLGLTAYIFIRNLCGEKLAALLGAGTLMLGGYATTVLRHLHSLEAALWLPLILLLVTKAATERRPVFLAMAGGLLGILSLGSFKVLALHALAISLAYFLFLGIPVMYRPLRPSGLRDEGDGGTQKGGGVGLRHILLACFFGAVLFLAISSAVTVPSLLELLRSSRTDPAQWAGLMEESFGGSYLKATRWSLQSYRGFLVLAVSSPIFIRANWANALFLGLCSTSLAIVGLAASRRTGGAAWATARFFLVLSLIFLFLPALTPPLMGLTESVEPLRRLHSLWFSFSRIARSSLGVSLSMGVLSAFGAKALLAQGDRAWRDLSRSLVYIVLFLLIPSGILWLIGTAWGGAPSPWRGLLRLSRHFSGLDWPLFLTIGLGLGLIIILRKRELLGPKGAVLVIFLLMASELIFAGRHLNRAYPRSLAFPPTPAVDFLKEVAGPSQGSPPRRVLSLMPSSFLAWYANVFPSNLLMFYGIHELGGHDPSIPLRYVKFFSRLARPKGSYGYRVQFHSSYLVKHRPLLDLLSVHYFILPPGTYLALDDLELIYDRDVRIYRNQRALPRSFVVSRWQVEPSRGRQLDRLFDGLDFRREVLLEKSPKTDPPPDGCEDAGQTGRVTYQEYLPAQVSLRVDLACPGILVMSDAYHRNWRAEVDGKAAELERANYLMRALALPAGRHEVRLWFEDPWLRYGLFLSGAGLLTLLGLGLWAFRSRPHPGRSSGGEDE